MARPDGHRGIRTGLIGFGTSGRNYHAPLLTANRSFDLRVIATTTHATEARHAYPRCYVVPTPAALFDMASTLDLIVVASPPHVHLEHGLHALGAGTHVVMDKPMADSAADAEALASAAERSARQLVVFHSRRWDGDFLTVSQLLKQGSLGRVVRFESSFERPSIAAARRRGPRASRPDVLRDFGSHLVDQAVLLFGPARVEHAELVSTGLEGGRGEDAFLALLHDNGVRTHLAMSRSAHLPSPRFRVHGESASYTVTGVDVQSRMLAEGVAPGSRGFGIARSDQWGRLAADDDGERRAVPTLRGDYPAFYRELATALRRGAPPPVALSDALRVVELLDDATRLARQ